MQRPYFNSLLIVLGIFFFVACGPVYETRYSLVPPESATGRACIFQCETSQSQCEQIQDLEKDRCEDQSQRDQEQCEWEYRRQGKKPKWYECGSTSCTSDYTQCEERFRRCYQTCGGTVSSENVCVYGCDQQPIQK